MLDEEQARILLWIRDNPQDRAEWLKAQASAGRPPTYPTMELSGSNGSIRFSDQVQESIRHFVVPANWDLTGKLYDLNPAGHAALAAWLVPA
jgi:hypothetical protein